MSNLNGLTYIPQTQFTGDINSTQFIRKGEPITTSGLIVNGDTTINGTLTLTDGVSESTFYSEVDNGKSVLSVNSDIIYLENSTGTPDVRISGTAGYGTVYDSLYNLPPASPVPVLTLALNPQQTTIQLDFSYIGKLVLFDTNISTMFTIVCPNINSQSQIGSVIRFCFVGNVSSPNSGVTIKDTYGRTLGVINTNGNPPPTNITNMITCYAISTTTTPQQPPNPPITVSRWCSDGLASVI